MITMKKLSLPLTPQAERIIRSPSTLIADSIVFLAIGKKDREKRKGGSFDAEDLKSSYDEFKKTIKKLYEIRYCNPRYVTKEKIGKAVSEVSEILDDEPCDSLDDECKAKIKLWANPPEDITRMLSVGDAKKIAKKLIGMLDEEPFVFLDDEYKKTIKAIPMCLDSDEWTDIMTNTKRLYTGLQVCYTNADFMTRAKKTILHV